LVQGTQGMVTYSEGIETAFTGDGTAENPGLVASADQLATGARSSADGAEQLVTGVTGLRDGLGQYADGADQLADGTEELAEGTSGLADGSDDLAEGVGELADGSDELAEGLRDGADSVPTYSAQERARMGEMAAAPVGTDAERQNEAGG